MGYDRMQRIRDGVAVAIKTEIVPLTGLRGIAALQVTLAARGKARPHPDFPVLVC
jgi:hypothetical protein